MPRMVAKLGDEQYVEWSTVVDAPTTEIMPRLQAVLLFGPERVERADVNVTSLLDSPYASAQELIAGNRAGEAEECLTLDEIRARYQGEAGATKALQGTTQQLALAGLAYIRTSDGAYIVKSRNALAGEISEAELQELLNGSDSAIEITVFGDGRAPMTTVAKDERGTLENA